MKTIIIFLILAILSPVFAGTPDSISTKDAAYFAFIFYQGAKFNTETFNQFLSVRMALMNPQQQEAFNKFSIVLSQILLDEAMKIVSEFNHPDSIKIDTLDIKKLKYETTTKNLIERIH